MRICLDLRYKTESGASSYIKNLVPQLVKQDKKNSYVAVKYPDQKFDFESRFDQIILSPQGSDLLHVLWTVLVLPSKLKQLKTDVYHAMKMPGPYWNKIPDVMTMHSIFDSYKGDFPVSFKTKLFISMYANRMIARSSRLIAVSRFIEEYLEDYYNIDGKNIDLIYHGIDETFRPMPTPEVSPVLEKYNLPNNYILCVGNITPVKNHITAFKAFAEIADQFPVNLVIVGGQGNTYFQQLKMTINETALSDRVFTPGFVGGQELVAIMSGAQLLVFPSLTEGCPVTMLEAFNCGLPIIASKRGGLWDLGHDVALFVDDPMDYTGIAKHLSNVLTSTELREKMRQDV